MQNINKLLKIKEKQLYNKYYNEISWGKNTYFFSLQNRPIITFKRTVFNTDSIYIELAGNKVFDARFHSAVY